jgi:uncharacterized protein (TIGR02466 family)
MKGEVHPLFPTPVAMYSLDRDFNNKELSFVKKQKLRPNTLNKTSVDTNVFKQKPLAALKVFCNDCIQHYFTHVIGASNCVSLRITQSWLNYTKKGEGHHLHHHANSYVSGVLYIEGDPKKDKIFFSTPVMSNNIELPIDDFNPFNSKEWWLPAETGRLLIFPSTLQHRVEPTETESRISLSFNTFLVGVLGSKNSLTELIL